MAEKNTILFEDLPWEIGKKLLSDETLKRLNLARTKFTFKGYNTKVSGFICIPVKFSKDPAKKKEQIKELRELGYSKVDAEELGKYRLDVNEREFYKIPIKKLVTIHEVTI